jgi:hypothetical protein
VEEEEEEEEEEVFLKLLPAELFWFRKITTDSHSLTHVNTECPVDRYPKFKVHISEIISKSYEYIPVSISNNELHDFNLIKNNCCPLLGYRKFLN